ncbi:MAG: DUF4932 domain-containing protein [Sphingobacteriia bacterium]|jgi:hypothetical protein
MKINILLLFLIPFFGCTQSKPKFSDEFIRENSGKYTISIPEVQELVHIIFAITEKGMNDSEMINHEGAYYQKVIEHFKPYANDPLVLSMNADLKGGIFFGSRYARLKMDACGYYFVGNQIIKDSTYNQLNWDNKNYIEPYLPALENFAIKTKFRQFYLSNESYYKQLIDLMGKQIPVQQIWNWLESRFDERYQNYWINFSPLANGNHSTNRFETNQFKQCVMFLCGPFEDSLLVEEIQEGLMSKVAFTEIDHNYVNPITDYYKEDVNIAFYDRNKWTSGKSSNDYKSPKLVFNEYMTYAVFVLYLSDYFKNDSFENLYKRITNQMENRRGFIRFKVFTDQLLFLYKGSKQPFQLKQLYPPILEWCKKN